jgi:hypothetical protein
LGSYSALAAVADRFDYPIGNRGAYTEANDGDGWYVALEFGEWSSDYSKYHLGEDWNAESGGNTDCGLPVYAVANGTIVYANIDTGWGRVLIVRHTLPDGSQVESLYGHLGSFAKTSGDVVRGDQIGTIGDGSEGGTTYPCHLHLEIRTAGCPNWGQAGPGYSVTAKPAGWVDPSDYLDSHRQTQRLDTVLLNDVTQWNYYDSGDFGVPELYSTSPITGLFESTTLGIRVKAHRYRGGATLITKSAYYLSGSVVTYTWSGTGGSSFMQSLFGPMTQVWPTDAGNLSIDCLIASYGNIYGNSWLATAGRTYVTVLTISDSSLVSSTTDIQTGTLMESRTGSFDFTAPLRLWLRTGDTYDYGNACIYLQDLRIASPLLSGVRIVQQPLSQTTVVGADVPFSVTAISIGSMNYQWRRDGNILAGATNAKLTVTKARASDSGGYSVVVWNAYGSVTSATASLAVLAVDTATQPTLPTYPAQPTVVPGKDSVVFITHGRTTGPDSDDDWVDTMKTSIEQVVPSNWTVIPYKWIPQSRTTVFDVKGAAEAQGRQAGAYIVTLGQNTPNQKWAHVHLIGHSAGGALINEAAKVIINASPTTTVHTTFLDAYTGVEDGGRVEYGQYSQWADSYFAVDNGTGDALLGRTDGRTDGPLVHAYNVDVTWLDPSALSGVDVVYSSDSTPAFQVFSSHGWPIQFYQDTITGGLPGAAGYGFPLSKEGGGWNNNPVTHPENNDPVALPVGGHQYIGQSPIPVRNDSGLQLNLLPNAASSSGVNFVGNSAASLSSDDPAWLAVGLTVTNAVNFIQFDGAFTDTNGAVGLLTVYWNTNQIGMVDERTASPGLQTYRFALPGTVADGLYTLGFRLDAFTNAASITVTNVATGFVGITQSIRLDMLRMGANSAPVVKLTAAPGYNYLVQSSTNFVDWLPTALLVNTNGSVLYADPTVINSKARFYRAVMP